MRGLRVIVYCWFRRYIWNFLRYFMEDILKNWEKVQKRIAQAAARAGRDSGEITVVAVTKTRTAAEVEAALGCGIRTIGENRVQEAEAKKVQVDVPAQWHLVGHLQTNKARKAVALFDLVQSVDSLRVAKALEAQAGKACRVLDILVQVNTSGEESKAGVAPQHLQALSRKIAALRHLRIRGLMTIGALSADTEVVRSCFVRLRDLRDRLAAARLERVEMKYLSMGMSGDFELAIAEGANMLRLGSVLFGPRPAA